MNKSITLTSMLAGALILSLTSVLSADIINFDDECGDTFWHTCCGPSDGLKSNNWGVPDAPAPLCPGLPTGSDDVFVHSDCAIQPAMVGTVLNIEQDTGTFTLSGTLSVGNIGTFDGPFVWNSGELGRGGGAAGQTVTCNGGLTMQGADQKTLSFFGGFRLVNTGAASWSGDGDWTIGMIPGACCPAIFENATGATFDVLNNEPILQNSFGVGRFENNGTLTKSSAGLSEWAVSFFNTGLVHVEQGELRFTRAGAIDGDWMIAPGAEVGFAGNNFTLEPGVNIQGRAVVKNSGTNPGVLVNNDVTIQDLTVASNGIIRGTATLTIEGTLTNEGGRPEARMHVLPGATIEEMGVGHFYGPLDIEGEVHIPNGSSLGCFNQLMNVMPGGVVTIDDGGTLNQTGLVTQPIDNFGTIRKPATSGTAIIHNFFERDLNNQPGGAISVEGGTMRCENRLNQLGNIDIAAGAEFSQTHWANYFETATFTGDGFFHINQAQNNFINAGVELTIPNFRTSGTLSHGIHGTGTLRISNYYDNRGGAIDIPLLTIEDNAALDIAGPDFTGGQNLVVENHGTTRLINQSLGFASFNNRPSGVVDIQADFAFLNWFSNGPCLNEGIFKKSAGAGLSEIVCSITNTGTFRAESGLMNFTNGVNTFTQNAGSTVLAGGSIRSLSVMTYNGGTLSGTGTITSNINNIGATVRPGASAGTMTIASQASPTIAGNYTQGAGGTFAIELGGFTPGTEHDQLIVAGTANLNGLLIVSLIDDFEPELNDSFTILTANNRVGMFSSVLPTNLPVGLGVEATYTATSVVLTIVPGAFDPGDLNCDGFVDGRDVQPFVIAVIDPVGYAAAYPDCDISTGDIDNNGMTEIADIGLFATVLLNQ